MAPEIVELRWYDGDEPAGWAMVIPETGKVVAYIRDRTGADTGLASMYSSLSSAERLGLPPASIDSERCSRYSEQSCLTSERPSRNLRSSRAAETLNKGNFEMAIMTRWDAFHDLRGAQDQMNEMYKLLAQVRGQQASQSGPGASSAPVWAPPVDIAERTDAYVLTVELPGVKVEDLEIAFQDGLLTIQGERSLTEDSADKQFHVLERRYGLFRRSITLPLHVQADAIEASTEDGVLQVVVPKVEEVKPKRIEVHAVRVSATADAPDSTPIDVEQEAADRGGRVNAMREHGHLDAAIVE